MATIEQRIEEVRNDRTHGSRWLAREAVSILYDLATDAALSPAEAEQRLHSAAQKLSQARPAMAAVAGAVQRILNVHGSLADIAQVAAELLEDIDTATTRILTYARPLIKGTLMTHSLSGTVLAVLAACASQIEQVIVLEGRPGYEGREVARMLAKEGIACTLITDAQADIFLPRCQAVIVGADTVLANGDVLNKAGTALLAWAAHGHKVPMYVLCETLKISPRLWSGELTLLEEKEPEEVLASPIPGVTPRNFYFDYTPARLVAKVVSEQGLLGRREIKQVVTRLYH
jgi:translation initiation factor 2B subunit (eIF-2B alpha/beta/delta family)